MPDSTGPKVLLLCSHNWKEDHGSFYSESKSLLHMWFGTARHRSKLERKRIKQSSKWDPGSSGITRLIMAEKMISVELDGNSSVK